MNCNKMKCHTVSYDEQEWALSLAYFFHLFSSLIYSQKQDQVDLYRQNLERHRYHIGRLELTMRLVDNDALDINLVCWPCFDVELSYIHCMDMQCVHGVAAV